MSRNAPTARPVACNVMPAVNAPEPETTPSYVPVAIVTGSNTGIGKATARKLVQQGYHVIMACRSAQRAEAAMEDIRAEVGASRASRIEFHPLDLASQASVRAFADWGTEQGWPLQLLILNAGFSHAFGGRAVGSTEEGLDMTMGVNHAGHFLLTALLLGPLARAGALSNTHSHGPARVVVISSILHAEGRIEPDTCLKAGRGLSGKQVYSVREVGG